MYQELSAKVDKVTYNAMVNMTMSLYPNYKDASAWDPANDDKYQKCTKQISVSNFKIQEFIGDIEFFSVNHGGELSIQIELEQILEDIELGPQSAKRLEQAIAYIKNVSLPWSSTNPCFEIEGYLERTREVVIRLKMIE